MVRASQVTSAEEPDGGNLHVRIWRGAGLRKWLGLLYILPPSVLTRWRVHARAAGTAHVRGDELAAAGACDPTARVWRGGSAAARGAHTGPRFARQAGRVATSGSSTDGARRGRSEFH